MLLLSLKDLIGIGVSHRFYHPISFDQRSISQSSFSGRPAKIVHRPNDHTSLLLILSSRLRDSKGLGCTVHSLPNTPPVQTRAIQHTHKLGMNYDEVVEGVRRGRARSFRSWNKSVKACSTRPSSTNSQCNSSAKSAKTVFNSVVAKAFPMQLRVPKAKGKTAWT